MKKDSKGNQAKYVELNLFPEEIEDHQKDSVSSDSKENHTSSDKEYDLTDQVKLVGIKPNPYPYIANCDVFVQSSIYEGKSIVLDEAKILCKPIVITNYVTAPNSIESGKNGLIVGMTSDELARGVASYFENEELRKQVVEQLRNEQNSNDAEIEKYIALFTELMESNV